MWFLIGVGTGIFIVMLLFILDMEINARKIKINNEKRRKERLETMPYKP